MQAVESRQWWMLTFGHSEIRSLAAGVTVKTYICEFTPRYIFAFVPHDAKNVPMGIDLLQFHSESIPMGYILASCGTNAKMYLGVNSLLFHSESIPMGIMSRGGICLPVTPDQQANVLSTHPRWLACLLTFFYHRCSSI